MLLTPNTFGSTSCLRAPTRLFVNCLVPFLVDMEFDHAHQDTH